MFQVFFHLKHDGTVEHVVAGPWTLHCAEHDHNHPYHRHLHPPHHQHHYHLPPTHHLDPYDDDTCQSGSWQEEQGQKSWLRLNVKPSWEPDHDHHSSWSAWGCDYLKSTWQSQQMLVRETALIYLYLSVNVFSSKLWNIPTDHLNTNDDN